MLNINSNLSLLNSLSRNDRTMNNLMTQLSSGKRINSASDDPAGMAVATRLRSASSALEVGNRNLGSVNSMLQTADSVAEKSTDVLQRMRDLVIEASNGTHSTSDLEAIQGEIDALKGEYENMVGGAKFNNVNLLDEDKTITVNTGTGTLDVSLKDITATDGTTGNANIDLDIDVTTTGDFSAEITKLDTAIDEVISVRQDLGVSMKAAEYREEVNNAQLVNTEQARSRIEDLDMAKAMSEFTQQQILQQANISLLQQSNQSMSSLLGLF